MKTKIVQLRVKIRSLAQEARLIRQEENRALCRAPLRTLRGAPTPGVPATIAKRLVFRWQSLPGARDTDLYASLTNHRRGELRVAAREALLTYACLRGRPYAQIEPRSSGGPDPKVWEVIRKMAVRFGVCYQPGESGADYKVRMQQQAEAIEVWIQEAQAYIGQQGSDRKVQAA